MSLMSFQWQHIGAELYLANKFTTNDDLVHQAEYNKASIALKYETSGSNISSLSSFGWMGLMQHLEYGRSSVCSKASLYPH